MLLYMKSGEKGSIGMGVVIIVVVIDGGRRVVGVFVFRRGVIGVESIGEREAEEGPEAES